MFTWIQTTFQKHFRVLFAVLLTVIVVTFVLTIGNQSFFGSGTNKVERREFFGYNLASQNDMTRLSSSAQISYMLAPDLRTQGVQLDQYAFARAAALSLADGIGVPAPSEEQLKAFVQEKPVFQNESGQFDASLYNNFVQMVSSQSQISQQVMGRTLQDDYRIEQLSKVLGGPGLVHPYALVVEEQESETVWTVDVATVSFANFTPELESSDEALQQFYEQNPQRYEVPEQVRVSAVRFPAENFVGQVQAPSEDELQAYFQRNIFRFRDQPSPPAEGEEFVEPADPEFEVVRDRVEQAWRLERARRVAAESADQFTVTLWREKVGKDSDRFRQLIERLGGRVEALPEYPRNRPPTGTGIARQAFDSIWVSARGERYFSDVSETPNGAAVLIYEETLSARQPDFAEVREQVAEANSQSEKRRLFAEHGEQLRGELKAAVDAGTTFREAAEALGMTVQTHENFKAATAQPVVLYMVLPEVRNLSEGDISRMTLRQTDGTLIYVAEKNVPALESLTIDRSSEESLPARIARLDPWMLYFELAEKELARGNIDGVRLQ